jgi:hypothetical protein
LSSSCLAVSHQGSVGHVCKIASQVRVRPYETAHGPHPQCLASRDEPNRRRPEGSVDGSTRRRLSSPFRPSSTFPKDTPPPPRPRPPRRRLHHHSLGRRGSSYVGVAGADGEDQQVEDMAVPFRRDRKFVMLRTTMCAERCEFFWMQYFVAAYPETRWPMPK